MIPREETQMPTYRRRPTDDRPKPEPEVEPEYNSNTSGKSVNDMIEQTPSIESHRQFFHQRGDIDVGYGLSRRDRLEGFALNLQRIVRFEECPRAFLQRRLLAHADHGAAHSGGTWNLNLNSSSRIVPTGPPE